MTENWKPLQSDPSYKVSDAGRVIGPKGRVLKPQANGPYGYLTVQIRAGNPRSYIHRLVAEVFIGPGDGLDVDHINGNTGDNRLVNLRYLSHAENMAAQRERKPYCHKGHSFSDAYWDPRGRRQCRTCRREADRRRKRP